MFSYEDRLQILHLPALKYRRIIGDIITGKYDLSVALKTPINKVSCTRGNLCKLVKESTRIYIRKYSFTSRIVNMWNSLPNYVVDVHSVDLFKTRLDNFWRCQDAGTGDRSESVV